MTRYFSNSEITLFKECRRRWWLKQYRRLRSRVDEEHGNRVLGTRIHRVLGAFYDPTDDFITSAQTALALWDRETAIALERAPDQERGIRADHDLGRAMLEGYFDWLETEAPDADYEFVSAEQEVAAPVTDEVTLIAKLDMRVRRRSDGARLFIDTKTVGNLTDLPKRGDLDEQFLFYGLIEYLLWLRAGKDPRHGAFLDGGVYNMLRKVKRTGNAKPPFYGRHEVRHNLSEIESFWYRVMGEIADIRAVEARLDAGEDHRSVVYPTPTRDCDWKCEFRALCPMLDDSQADAEGLIADAYEEGDPYARYVTLDLT